MPLFRKSSKVDDTIASALVSSVAQAFVAQGMPVSEVARMATQVVGEATRDSRAAGGGQPPGYGEDFLRRAKSGDVAAAAQYKARIEDGVTDADIRWYWGMSDLEKRVIDKMSDQARLAHFIHAMEELAAEHPKNTEEQLADLAAGRLRKWHPSFGDPSDESHASGADRPLYPELKDRIDRYLERGASNTARVRAAIGKATSFNAWVRSQIRAGKL